MRVGLKKRVAAVAAAAMLSLAGMPLVGSLPVAHAADDWEQLVCDVELTHEQMLNYQVPKANRPYRIALLQVSLEGYYYEGIAYGAFKAAEQAGVELTMYAASGYASPEQQLAQMEDALQQNVDAIVMAPSDIYGSVPAVELARERGLPVVNVSTEVAHPDVYMVMQDDIYLGMLAADQVAELLDGRRGRGIIIAGPANATWSLKRTQAFQARVREKYPNIEIVSVEHQLVNPAEGLMSFEDAIQRNPEIEWVYAVHQYILPALALPDQYRGNIIYVGNGLEPDSIEWLREGLITRLLGIQPIATGLIGVGRAVDLLNGTSVPRITCLSSPIYTQDNVDLMPSYDDNIFPPAWRRPW